MPFVTLPSTPIAPGRRDVRIHVRDRGSGPAVVLLHSGWGHEAYPFDRAAEVLAARGHRVLVPDRVGYGRSDPIDALPRRFHEAYADELVLLLDALGIADAALWGHSDGAVIAAWTAIRHPGRVRSLVLEAAHYTAVKPGFVEFFRNALESPEGYGERAVTALQRDHGERWRAMLGDGARAWLAIVEDGYRGVDLYGGRLGEIRAPTLLLHGKRDPRTEPGELAAALRALPGARLEELDAGHSPHNSPAAAERCIALAAAFIEGLT